MKKVLVIVAHGDDEILGCGGTIARHTQEGDKVRVLIMACRGQRAPQQVKMAQKAREILNYTGILFSDLVDQKFDNLPFLAVTQKIEEIAKIVVNPNIIYTHSPTDLNLDHQIVVRAVMTAFRPLPGSSIEAIYGMEVLSSTEWGLSPFIPNHFVALSTENFAAKMKALEAYKDEMRPFPHARSFEAVHHQAISRGNQVGLPLAEAFTVLRSIRRDG